MVNSFSSWRIHWQEWNHSIVISPVKRQIRSWKNIKNRWLLTKKILEWFSHRNEQHILTLWGPVTSYLVMACNWICPVTRYLVMSPYKFLLPSEDHQCARGDIYRLVVVLFWYWNCISILWSSVLVDLVNGRWRCWHMSGGFFCQNCPGTGSCSRNIGRASKS
jgi:hypothetical protein